MVKIRLSDLNRGRPLKRLKPDDMRAFIDAQHDRPVSDAPRTIARLPRRTRETRLRPIHPNVGIERDYQRRIVRLLSDMHDSVLYWLTAAYRANPPVMAQDETATASLRAAIHKLKKRWIERFDDGARDLAEYFAQSVADRSDAALRKILKDSGFTVDWRMTRAQREIIQATVHQNVSLIKSIPEQYLGSVETMVMQSVQTGRDLGQLTKDIEEKFGVEKRRAAFIARDQNNKATAALGNVRKIEIAGVDAEEIWIHSGGGRHPRPTHVAAGKNQVRFKISEGWLDPALGKRIWPGTEPNCRCVGRLVVKGFS